MAWCVRPWKAALKDDQVTAVGGHACQLDGGFNGLGPAVGEKELVDALRCDLIQFLRQCYSRGRYDDVHLAEDQLGGLFLDGLHHAGVAVAGVGHTNTRGKVGVTLAAGVIQIDTFAPYRLHLRHMGPNGSQQINRVAHVADLLVACADRGRFLKRQLCAIGGKSAKCCRGKYTIRTGMTTRSARKKPRRIETVMVSHQCFGEPMQPST